MLLLTIIAALSSMTVSISAVETTPTYSKAPRDILVWDESRDEVRMLPLAYCEWTLTDEDDVLGFKGTTKIGKQHLKSYRYENLNDEKMARAEVTNYTYNSSTDTYTYGWTNATDCYCRARMEDYLWGNVLEDSGRKFGRYTSQAETTEPIAAYAKTYCGNLAAD